MDYNITNITFVVLCALCSGMTLSVLGHTPILGYIIAGIILGPSGFQFIQDREAVHIFSDMGILFLLFIIGLGLSFDKVKKIWKSSFAATLLSLIGSLTIAFICGKIFNWSTGVIILSAFCATLSSTAVTVKAIARLKEKFMQEHSHDANPEKHYDIENSTVGILISQDLLALIMIIVLQGFGDNLDRDFAIYQFTPSLLFILFIYLYFKIYYKHVHKFTNFIKKHEELLSVTTFGICLGGAVWAELAGLSAPFGAFLAGVIMGNSDIRDHLRSIASTFEEILLMTFFLAVGLLVDLNFVWNNIWGILIALLFVTVGKTLLNFCVLRTLKFSLKESFMISILLGHLGEFSFLLTQIALKNKIISTYGVDFLITLTALSLFFSPFWLIFAQRCEKLTRNMNISSPMDLVRLASQKEIRRISVFFHLIKRSILFISHPIIALAKEYQNNKKRYAKIAMDDENKIENKNKSISQNRKEIGTTIKDEREEEIENEIIEKIEENIQLIENEEEIIANLQSELEKNIEQDLNSGNVEMAKRTMDIMDGLNTIKLMQEEEKLKEEQEIELVEKFNPLNNDDTQMLNELREIQHLNELIEMKKLNERLNEIQKLEERKRLEELSDKGVDGLRVLVDEEKRIEKELKKELKEIKKANTKKKIVKKKEKKDRKKE